MNLKVFCVISRISSRNVVYYYLTYYEIEYIFVFSAIFYCLRVLRLQTIIRKLKPKIRVTLRLFFSINPLNFFRNNSKQPAPRVMVKKRRNNFANSTETSVNNVTHSLLCLDSRRSFLKNSISIFARAHTGCGALYTTAANAHRMRKLLLQSGSGAVFPSTDTATNIPRQPALEQRE